MSLLVPDVRDARISNLYPFSFSMHIMYYFRISSNQVFYSILY